LDQKNGGDGYCVERNPVPWHVKRRFCFYRVRRRKRKRKKKEGGRKAKERGKKGRTRDSVISQEI